jgi:hypothetical protein
MLFEVRRTLLIHFLFLACSAGITCGQGSLSCEKYPTSTTPRIPTCRRVGVLPWFVAIPGSWETELRLGATGDNVSVGFISSISLTSFSTNLVLEDSEAGASEFEAISQMNLGQNRSHWTRVLGTCGTVDGAPCPESATGSMIVTADAPNAAALDAISASAVYRHLSNGSVQSETSAPVIFLDQAAVRWSAMVTETPRDQQSQSGATSTSYAVANLSPDPQAILIRVYDERGNLAGSAKTPVLGQSLTFLGWSENLVGGVYAGTLSNTLGINLPVSDCFKCVSPPVFRGTVVFEGEKGGLIAPVVFSFNGSAITTVPVKAN